MIQRPAVGEEPHPDALHVLAVMSGILPYPAGMCGVPLVTWSVVAGLRARGHRVTICTFGRSRLDAHRDEAAKMLSDIGVRVHDLDPLVPSEPRRSVWANRFNAVRRAIAPRVEDLYPHVRFLPHLQRVVDEERPDAMYVFDFNVAIVAARLERRPPGLAAVINLDHIASRAKRRKQPPRRPADRLYRLLDALAERRLPALEVQAVQPFERVVDHAAHHAEWLRRRGVSNVIYLPNPVSDVVGQDCHALRQRLQEHKATPTVLFIGRLDSIINRPALDLLAFEILPTLERELGPEGFVLELVGSGELLPRVDTALDRPCVRRRGYVERSSDEFLACDVLVVPTPDELGFRTRVAEAFSFGCCVVSHSANRLGMPELVHEDNALLAGTGHGIALQIVRALKDADLRDRLQRHARETYERSLAAPGIAATIAEEMEQAIHERTG